MSKYYTSRMSQVFGGFANKKFSKFTQKIINNSYVKLMGLDMSEFNEPSEYESLNALFTRALKEPRKFDKYDDSIVSPVDGLVTECGDITDGTSYQIKGMEYKIDELLGHNYSEDIALLENGDFVNLYLSPKDYHRYHMPMPLKVLSTTHIPGKLYPVNKKYLNKKKNLFIENERVIVKTVDSKGKIHFLVLIGALNVGKMVVTFEDRIKTNIDTTKSTHYTYTDDNIYDKKMKLKKGDLFGWFEMGSTILMFSQKDAVKYNLEVGKSVKFADKIGSVL